MKAKKDIAILFYKAWCKKVGLKESDYRSLKMYIAIKGIGK